MRTAFVTCLLLFVLMQNASSIPGMEKENYEGILKKLEARETRPVEFGWEDIQQLLTLIKDFEVRLTKIEEEIREWKHPQTTAQPTTEGPCTAIGVSDDIYAIPDEQITATSHYLQYYPFNGRLNGASGWCAETRDDPYDYLQIDMGAEYSVCAVATQGKPASYTKSYILAFSTDGKDWSTYKEDGEDKEFVANEDADSIVQNSLSTKQEARYVRFYPTANYIYPCMRLEIYVMS